MKTVIFVLQAIHYVSCSVRLIERHLSFVVLKGRIKSTEKFSFRFV